MTMEIKISNEIKTVYGYVVAVKGYSPDRSPAFAVELHVLEAPAAERLQWFSTYEVRDNRELVWVSLLRDAMIHSLPVALMYDGLRNIISLEVRSDVFYAKGDSVTVVGKVKMISVDEFGLWKENIDIPDSASVILSGASPLSLVLSLQSPPRETKLAQLDMLRRAYQEQSDVTITYQKTPVMGGTDDISNVIVGVQIGTKLVTSPKLPRGRKKRTGQII